MQKRGQATIIATVGIIVLILAILLFYYRESILTSKWEKERAASMVVPEDAKELHNYIYTCVAKVSEAGIALLGLQGGYINLPKDYFRKGPANPFSTSLQILPESDLRAAYWFQQTPNNVQKSAMPSIEFMEDELASYANKNLIGCLNNFDGFEEYDIEEGPLSTTVDIKNNGVYFTINYPIAFTRDTFSYSFDKFFFNSDAQLGRLYSIANNIIAAENKYFFFEELTIDSLVLYDEIPYSGIDFKCGSQIWTKEKVKESIKEIIQTNMQFVKVEGSDFLLGEDKRKYFVFNIGPMNSDVKASFKYSKNWPMEVEVFPSKGSLLRGDEIGAPGKNAALSMLTSLLCITNYHFVYDINYPLLVTLLDKNGYLFQFATEVIIDNNQPRENRLGVANLESTEPEICEHGMSNIRVYALGKNPDETVTPLEGANIKFKCITTTCDMGATRKEENDAYLERKFPQCLNGLLTADSPGYHTGKAFLSTINSGDISVLLDPIYSTKFEIRVIENGIERKPSQNEKIIFELSEPEKSFVATLLWPSEQTELNLIAGNYNVKSYIIEDSPFDILIEGKDIESCTEPQASIFGIFGEKKCETIKVPPTTLDQVVKGGGSLDWEISQNDLSNANKVIFYTVADKIPASYEEMDNVYERIEGRRGLKKPEVVI